MKKRLLLLFSTLFLLCNPIQAAENLSYICSLDGKERKIEVVYLQEDKRAPCEVHYIKDSVSQLLWNARREEGFCELKAQAFIEKQKSWGWVCLPAETKSNAES